MRLTGRQVNLLLEALILVALTTGVASWIAPVSWGRPLLLVHAVAGFSVVVVAPLKVTGPVRTGMRRGRASRWLSVGFGVAVLVVIALGLAHSTGWWFGVGYWSALWTHQFLGFAIAPLALWHVLSRPVRPRTADVDRRGLLASGMVTVGAIALVGAQEAIVQVVGGSGAARSRNGSHAAGSYDPDAMPVVQWFDDAVPSADALGLEDDGRWSLTVGQGRFELAELRALARPLEARLDCTGGWFADQIWDAVPVSELLDGPVRGRSIRVRSLTGYQRHFPVAEADRIHLAVGYQGQPLRRGHGAPVRLVVPGRRGPEWVKWVVEVTVVGRPSWLEAPLPTT